VGARKCIVRYPQLAQRFGLLHPRRSSSGAVLASRVAAALGKYNGEAAPAPAPAPARERTEDMQLQFCTVGNSDTPTVPPRERDAALQSCIFANGADAREDEAVSTLKGAFVSTFVAVFVPEFVAVVVVECTSVVLFHKLYLKIQRKRPDEGNNVHLCTCEHWGVREEADYARRAGSILALSRVTHCEPRLDTPRDRRHAEHKRTRLLETIHNGKAARARALKLRYSLSKPTCMSFR